MRTLAGILCLFTLLTAVGCGPRIADPQVVLRDMKAIPEANGLGFTMNFLADIYNPNNISIPAGKIEYALYLDKKRILTGTVAGPVTLLPPQSRMNVIIPVHVYYVDLLEVEDAIHETGGALQYALMTRFYFSTGKYHDVYNDNNYPDYRDFLPTVTATYDNGKTTSNFDFSNDTTVYTYYDFYGMPYYGPRGGPYYDQFGRPYVPYGARVPDPTIVAPWTTGMLQLGLLLSNANLQAQNPTVKQLAQSAWGLNGHP